MATMVLANTIHLIQDRLSQLFNQTRAVTAVINSMLNGRLLRNNATLVVVTCFKFIIIPSALS